MVLVSEGCDVDAGVGVDCMVVARDTGEDVPKDEPFSVDKTGVASFVDKLEHPARKMIKNNKFALHLNFNLYSPSLYSQLISPSMG